MEIVEKGKACSEKTRQEVEKEKKLIRSRNICNTYLYIRNNRINQKG